TRAISASPGTAATISSPVSAARRAPISGSNRLAIVPPVASTTTLGSCDRSARSGACAETGAGRAGRTVPSTVSATRADPAAQRALEARTGVRRVKLRAREAFERNGSMGLSETGGTARTMRPRGRGPSFDAGPVIDKVRTPLARTRPVVVVSPAGLHLPCDVARLPLLPFGYIGDVTWPTTRSEE